MELETPYPALKEAIPQILSPRPRRRWAYFAGNHPKAWVNQKTKEIFQGLADSMTENYCALAVSTRVSRLEVTGWGGNGAARAEQLWADSGLPARQDMIYRWGIVHGAVYLLAGENQDGTQTVAPNPATLMYGKPDQADWASLDWAVKMWPVGTKEEGNTEWLARVWDDVNLWNLRAPRDPNGKPPKADQFIADVEATDGAHGYPTIPVVAAYPFGAFSPVLIDQIAPVQDRINKLGSNKFVAAEFGAFRQRVFFTRQALDPYDVQNAPDRAIVLDPGDGDGKASVQEFAATDLANYDAAKDAEVDALFTIATLPRHLRVNPGVAPSGEAIKADEGPFVEACTDHQREFGEAMSAILRVMGVEDAAPVWRDLEVRNDLANAQTVRTLVEAGLPWQVAAERFLGMTPEEVADAEALAASTSALTAQQVGDTLRAVTG